MKTTRREFLRPPPRRRSCRRSCSACRTRPARSRPSSAAAPTPTKRSTTGATLPAAHQVGQHPRRGRGLAGAHLRPSHRPRRPARAPDSMVVFDAKGQVRPVVGPGIPRRRARPAHPQGRARRVSLSHGQRHQPAADAAAADAGGGGQGDADGRDRLEDPGSAGRRGLHQPTPTVRAKRYNPTNVGDRAERRRLRRRRVRLVLHQPVQQQGRAHPDLRRQGSRAGAAERAARYLDGYARRLADPRGRRSPEQPPAALHAGRRARRLRPGLPPAVPLPRAEGPGRHSRLAWPRDADGSEQPLVAHLGDSNPTNGTIRCARSRAISSSRASSSARTARASITTGTSSSSNGSKSGG